MKHELFKDGYGAVRKSPTGYWYFVPSLKVPEDIYTPGIAMLLSEADRKLGELSGLGQLMPNPDLLVMPYMRREAVESSRIEGTQANLTDLLLGEVAEVPAQKSADVQEVQNYIAAMQQGLKLLPKLPLSTRLLREVHKTLITSVRGNHATPGEFRRSQNWIGASGSTPETATYVPPSPHEVPALLTEWEKLLHERTVLPPLLHIALLHWQFEAIHPFLDGNGRIGRLLITLYLCERGELSQPLLYLSEYFQQHREEYIGHLLAINQKGDFDGWFRFFLLAVREQAEDAAKTSTKLLHLQSKYRSLLATTKVTPTMLIMVEQLFRNPYITAATAKEHLKLSGPAIRTAIERLQALGIIEEMTGKERHRIYRAKELLKVLRAE